MLDEGCSIIVVIAINNEHFLEAQERCQKTIMGARLNVLSRSDPDELGSCKVRKDVVVAVDG